MKNISEVNTSEGQSLVLNHYPIGNLHHCEVCQDCSSATNPTSIQKCCL